MAVSTGKLNRPLSIATAPSRRSKLWRNREVVWEKFVSRIAQVTRTGETMAEYRAMPKPEKDARKDVGGFVFGKLKGGRRRKGYVEYRDAVCLDADHAPKFSELTRILEDLTPSGKRGRKEDGARLACCAYPTHSCTPDQPRYRIIIPLSRRITSEEYEPIARRAAESVGIDYMDATTYEPERLMYWPSVPADADAAAFTQDGDPLDASAVLASYADWHDASTWPTGKRETVAVQQTLKKLGDPREKPGIIGLFCKAYSIKEAIAEFLPDVYTPVLGDENRYTYTKGSTTGGAIVYDELFLCSHHDTDPAGGGHEVNAFDLVRLHKFGRLDENTAETVPVNNRPSYQEMVKFAWKDAKVSDIADEDIVSVMKDDLIASGMTPEEAENVDTDWKNKLIKNKGGGIIPNAQNVLLIMRNDVRITKMVGLDTFSDRLTVLKKLPWDEKNETGRVWKDTDDANLRNWFAEKFGIQAKGIIDDGIAEMSEKNRFHPVRDWLRPLVWDELPRVERFFVEFLGAPDTRYTRELTKVFFKQAIARIMHPGCKADIVLVLVGPQGIGKSYVLSHLGGKWFNDTLTSVQGKEAMVQIQGSWIVEMGEFTAGARSGTDEIKAYVTRQVDKFRAPYGKRVQEYPRQCVFAATTNEDIFLRDRTGNRRFGVLICEGVPIEERRRKLDRISEDFTKQLWAEAREMYKDNPDLLLPADVQDEARRIQEEHTEGAEKAALIENFLNTPRPRDWEENYPLERRREFFAKKEGGEFDSRTGVVDDNSDYILPQRTCAMEILCELFGMNQGNIRNLDVREINTILQHLDGWKRHEGGVGILKFSLYGKQRAYVRKSTEERH